ncbi:hypothetical protein BH09CHL1_BH09CHL1_12860 [soil metagenome]
MSSSRSLASRIARILAVGAIALAATPQLSTSAQTFEEPFDLPSALIYPEDAAQAGFEDYGLVMGWYATPEDLILTVTQSGEDPEETRAAIEETGMGTMYQLSLHPISEPRDGELYGIAIESTVAQFTDADHASDGLETIMTAIPGDDYELVEELDELGDESMYVAYQNEAGELSPQVENTVDIGIRVGDVVGAVTLRGLGEGIEIDLEQAQEMAEVLAAKLENLVQGHGTGMENVPDLSLIMPDYFNEVLCVCRIQYMIYGGEAIDLAYRADEMEARQGLAEDYGVRAQLYALIKPATRNEEDRDPSLRVRVTRFDQRSEAAVYIEEASTWMSEFPEHPQPIAVTEVIADYGDVDGYDSSIALGYETEGSETGAPLEGAVMLVQNGRYVFEVSLDGHEAPELDVLLDVVAQLEACMDEACVTSTDVPESVMDYFIEQAEIANA